MFILYLLLCLAVFLDQISSELVLKNDVVEKVTFVEANLEIEVDNSRGVEGDFTLCIKATTKGSRDCLTGYGRISFGFGNHPDIKIFKVDRQGKVMIGAAHLFTIRPLFFTEDGALEVVLKEVPDRSTIVKLLNAERYVSTEPTEATTLKTSNSMATFSVVVVVLVAMAGVLIAGVIVITCYCRSRTKTEQSHEQDRNHETSQNLKAHKHSVTLPTKSNARRTSSTTVTTTVLPTTSASSVVAVFPERVQNMQ